MQKKVSVLIMTAYVARRRKLLHSMLLAEGVNVSFSLSAGDKSFTNGGTNSPLRHMEAAAMPGVLLKMSMVSPNRKPSRT